MSAQFESGSAITCGIELPGPNGGGGGFEALTCNEFVCEEEL